LRHAGLPAPLPHHITFPSCHLWVDLTPDVGARSTWPTATTCRLTRVPPPAYSPLAVFALRLLSTLPHRAAHVAAARYAPTYLPPHRMDSSAPPTPCCYTMDGAAASAAHYHLHRYRPGAPSQSPDRRAGRPDGERRTYLLPAAPQTSCYHTLAELLRFWVFPTCYLLHLLHHYRCLL